jgi:uncharacterized lipoprotein YddW (UPF0748 family)
MAVRKLKIIIGVALIGGVALTLVLPVLNSALSPPKDFKWRAIWVHPRDLGRTPAEVEAFFDRLQECQINLVFPLVKGSNGAIFWQSKQFTRAIHPDYRHFDLLRAVVRAARQRRIKVHPWLCDFPEGQNSPAFQEHPEWAMRNPEGGITADEKLAGGRPYRPVWMCPVRRPGYVDQWLQPMIKEIVTDYEVDGIHHDYVRYPGDVAPDSYCFCDACLEHYLRYNHFIYPSRPEKRLPLQLILPRPEANWHYDQTLVPENWSQMSRQEKARYLLEGKAVNRNDLDYYFYETRCDAIAQFVRDTTRLVKEIKPRAEVSAAVFINPMRAGRHIGQRWTDWLGAVDFLAPMNYRSHFQGSFNDYLVYLSDYTRSQLEWAHGEAVILSGITGHYIYREERSPWEEALNYLKGEDSLTEKQFVKLMEENLAYLGRFSPSRKKELQQKLRAFLKNPRGKKEIDELIQGLQAVLSSPPRDFFPPEKFLKTIETVRQAGADGVAIFSAGIITRNHLWGALEKAFAPGKK